MTNTLYLLEMGTNLREIETDIKNCRIRTIENIDIKYNGEIYNLFFEFLHGVHWHYRKENLRNGKPLKKPVYTVDVKDGIYLDTQYEKPLENYPNVMGAWRLGAFEREMWAKHYKYTKANILRIVNNYKVGEKYNKVCLIQETAKNIILKSGGWREKDILNTDSVFSIGETWNEEHKIVRCNKRENNRITDFCEIDLVTGRITG